MKKLYIAVIVLFILAKSYMVYAVTLRIDPETILAEKTITSFTAAVVIEDITDLGGFEFTVNYESTILGVTNINTDPNNFLGSTGRTRVLLPPDITYPGKVKIAAFSFNGPKGPDGGSILAKITFSLKTQKNGLLSISDIEISNTSNPPLILQDSDIEIINGKFTPCYITATAGSNGTIAPVGEIPLTCGASQTFTIAPNDCYNILDVKTDGLSQGAVESYTFPSVTTHQTIDASFDIDKHTVDFVAGTGGNITDNNPQTVNCGSNCTSVSAVPDSKHEFLNWTWDTTSSADNPFTYGPVISDKTITANFIPIYTVIFTVNPVGSGSITGNTTQIIRENKSCSQVTASPATGYHFVNWTLPDGTVLSTNQALTYGPVTQDTNVTANFELNEYTVNFTADSFGTIEGVLSQKIKHGSDTLPVTAKANDCYKFKEWTGDYIGTENPLIIHNVTKDMNIKAVFEIAAKYNVLFTSGANGKITGITSQIVDCGACATEVKAEPDPCYKFTGWSGDYTGTENPLKLCNITKSMNITANFEVSETYTVTFTSDPNGKIEGNAVQQIPCGKDCTPVTAVPNSSCYKFKEWTVDYIGTENPLTIKNVTKNMNIKAVFEIAETYTVTFESDPNGKIEGNTVQQIPCGKDCSQVTAVPNSCYKFKGWTGDYTGTENPLTITNVTKNMNIHAVFEKKPSIIIGVNGPCGKVEPPALECGVNNEQINAIPTNDCCRFTSWSGDLAGIENPLIIENITSDMKIIANFETIPYKIDFQQGENGTLTGNTSQTVNCGGCSETVTAVPNDCYTFKQWSGDNTGTQNPLSVCDIRKNMIIKPVFEIIKYPVKFISGANGKITGETSQTVDCGKCSTAVTAEPNECYKFTGWSGDYTGTDNPLILCNVNKPMNITANFEIVKYPVSFISGANGKITGETSQTVDCGACATEVKAEPNDCYKFTNWSGDYTGTENPLILCNVKKPMNITANFEIIPYTVTFTEGKNGKVTGNTSQTVNCGGCLKDEVKAEPDDCYNFLVWSGDYHGTENPPKICNIKNDMNITPVFESKQYTVNFTDGENGKITGKLSQTVNCNGCAESASAVPDSCYQFKEWKGDYTGTENPLNLCNITKDTTVIPVFEIRTYDVIFTSNENGKIDVESSQKGLKCGSNSSQVTAVPNTGYEFTGWSGSYIGTENPLTLSNITDNMNITANFAPIDCANIFTVEPKESGIIQYTFNEHDGCTHAEAVPSGCYDFTGWSGDYTGTENPLPITSDIKNVTANFSVKKFTVSFIEGDNGTIEGNKSQTVICYESTEKVTAKPENDCYKFIGWTGDYTGTENSPKLANITKDMNIKANFAQIEYQVHFDTVGNGSLVIDNDSDKPVGEIFQYVKCGNDSLPVTAIPGNNSYKFTGWTGDYTGTENPLTIEKVTRDMTVTAHFDLIDSKNAPVISIRPGDVNQQSGIFDVKIVIENSPECGELEFTLDYDPDAVFIEDKSYISLGDFWNNKDGILLSIDDEIPGKLKIKISLNKNTTVYPNGSGTILNIPFKLKEGKKNSSLTIENLTFKNPAGSLVEVKSNLSQGISLPIVTTGNVDSDKSGIISCSGHISSDIIPKATEKGVCWSTSENPVTGKNNVSCSTDCTGSEDFTCSVTGLKPNKIYYFRAYTANMIGTGYGKDVLYSTSTVRYPVVSSIETASFTTTIVSFNVNISSDGGYPLKAKGVCWNRSSAPQIEAGDKHTDNGKGTGSFSTEIKGLTPGGIYCVRAYASNAVKTAYSEEIYIIMPTLPIVITDTKISDINSTGASCRGDVTDNGAASLSKKDNNFKDVAETSVTAKGICWSTWENPLIDNAVCSVSGTGEGEFTASLTGLTPDKTYYIRAYATNMAGTVYGEQVSFVTPKELGITVSKIDSVTVTSTSAEIKADVIGDGGFPVTERGICWSKSDSELPALKNSDMSSCSSSGTGKGEFTALITGLTPNNTYHIRGYAANQKDTVYGDKISFKTKVIAGDVNGDGKINLSDAILALKILSEIETAEVIYSDADINNDGKIGIEEVIYILRKIM